MIKVELITKPSINAVVGVSVVTASEPCWMNPNVNFLADD